MVYRPTVITDSILEAVSLDDFKEHVRLTSSYTVEDTLMETYLVAARKLFENLCCRTVHEKTLEWPLSVWPTKDYIVLPRATPLIAIVSMKYKDQDGAETTWAASNYIADTDSTPGRLVLTSTNSWPGGSLYPVNPIRVRYRAGIATTSPDAAAPSDVQLVIKQIAAGMWEHREAEPQSEPGSAGPLDLQYGIRGFIEDLMVHG
jgi:uncharacterized phiE125 gp8 family phage protein